MVGSEGLQKHRQSMKKLFEMKRESLNRLDEKHRELANKDQRLDVYPYPSPSEISKPCFGRCLFEY